MAFPKEPLELYTRGTQEALTRAQWSNVLKAQHCSYLNKTCIKTRKSDPDISIGTCTVGYQGIPTIICPHRFLQRRQIFLDAIHLLKRHDPGNQLHVVPEVQVPGGNIDYFVVSTHRSEVRDYLAIEIQALDTTGTVWPSRQQVIDKLLEVPAELPKANSYGMNWKMTAKTILVQLHHKVTTLELLNKKMILIIQDVFFDYMVEHFSTASLHDAEDEDSTHFHIYEVTQLGDKTFSIDLTSRHSTTAVGIEQVLGLRRDAAVSEETLTARIRAKISDETLLTI